MARRKRQAAAGGSAETPSWRERSWMRTKSRARTSDRMRWRRSPDARVSPAPFGGSGSLYCASLIPAPPSFRY